MEITCAQMDVLLSFYIEGDLSKSLKKQVEKHLNSCSTCSAKYNIIKTLLEDMHSSALYTPEFEDLNDCNHYREFRRNLSAYVDNELSSDESIKIKKYTINNKRARKELEDTYNIRKLMSDSFNKTRLDVKQDFSKNVLKQLTPAEECNFTFHPVIKIAVAFVMTVLVLSCIILFSLTMS